MPTHDLLIEPAFHVTLPDGMRTRLTLPGVLAELAPDDIVSFDHLRPHQEHGWYAFLVQLAAISLVNEGVALDKADEATWRDRLLHLTEEYGGHAPWCLVVGDLSLPAFMQPPVPDVSLRPLKTVSVEPDSSTLDLLVSGRMHDIKANRIHSPNSDHWAYALVTLQTMQGYSGGKGLLQGIARMNSGAGNRPIVATLPSFGYGARFRRDTIVHLRSRSAILDDFPYKQDGGHALLWLLPWDGTTSLTLNQLDPFFIEVCRRLRLTDLQGELRANSGTSTKSRVTGKDLPGSTGDAWTPVDATKQPLTIGSSGFSYKRTSQLLFGRDFRPSAAQRLLPEDPDRVFFYGWALARGIGKSAGVYERWIDLPGSLRRRLFCEPEWAGLAQISKVRVAETEMFQKSVLRVALCGLLQGGPAKLKLNDGRASPWVRRHDAAVDAVFFQNIWRDLDINLAEAQLAWQRDLIEMGRKILRQAETSNPLPAVRKYRSVASAERMFEALARKHFPDAFSTKEKQYEPSE